MRVNVRRQFSRINGVDQWSMPHVNICVTTADGVDLSVTKLGSNAEQALIVAHAFLGYKTKPAWRRLSETLAQRFTVYAVDLRGHGESGGWCTGGPLEALDVRAVAELARSDDHKWVGSIGGSLGGAAVLFEAASSASCDLVCAISPPSRWVRDLLHEPSGDEGLLRRRLLWVFGSASAQVGAQVLFGTRVSRHWVGAEAPLDVVDRISAPLLIIHGEDDHLFPASAARAMAARAGGPAQLVMIEGFGHCEDGFDEDFCNWLCDELQRVASSGLPVMEAS